MVETITVQVPSADVPAAPSFSVRVPPSWTARAAPGVVAAFDVPAEPSWSVVISSLRVGADTTLRDVAVRSFARQRQQHPDATIRVQRTGRFGDRTTYFREVGVPGTVATAQLHALFALPVGEGPLSDVLSVVASCPDGQLEQLGPPVVELVSSFRREGH